MKSKKPNTKYWHEAKIRDLIKLYRRSSNQRYLTQMYSKLSEFILVLVRHRYKVNNDVLLDDISHNIASACVLRFFTTADYRFSTKFLQLEIKRYFNPVPKKSIKSTELNEAISTRSDGVYHPELDMPLLLKGAIGEFRNNAVDLLPFQRNDLTNIIMFLGISIIGQGVKVNGASLARLNFLVNFISVDFANILLKFLGK